MRKCPNCTEENMKESLFCKDCGRCLLAPDPEEGQRWTVMQAEPRVTQEDVVLYDVPVAKESGAARLQRSHLTLPSLSGGWLLLVNLLLLIAMSEVASYLIIKSIQP